MFKAKSALLHQRAEEQDRWNDLFSTKLIQLSKNVQRLESPSRWAAWLAGAALLLAIADLILTLAIR